MKNISKYLLTLYLPLLLFQNTLAQSNEYTYNLSENNLDNYRFSPNNNLLSVTSPNFIDVWELTTQKLIAHFENNQWNSSFLNSTYPIWSHNNQYILAQNEIDKSQMEYFILDVNLSKKYKIDSVSSDPFLGFTDEHTLWTFNSNTKTLTTHLFNISFSDNTINTQMDWSVQCPPNTEKILFVPEQQNFVLMSSNNIIGVIRTGQNKIAELNKNIQNTIKQMFVYSISNDNCLLFKKTGKKPEFNILNLKNMELKPAFEKDEPYQANANFNMTFYYDTFTTFTYFYPHLISTGYPVNTETNSRNFEKDERELAYSNDLSRVLFRSVFFNYGIRTQLLKVFNTSDMRQKPITLISPQSAEMLVFYDYVKNNEVAFDRYLNESIEKYYTAQDWEMVSDFNMNTHLESNYAQLKIEKGYVYNIVRIGYDEISRKDESVLPDNIYTKFTVSVNSTDDYWYDSKEYTSYPLGFNGHQLYLRSNKDITANIGFIKDEKDFRNILPKNTFRVLAFRKPYAGSQYISDELLLDDYLHIKEKIVVSSSSSSDDLGCKPVLDDDYFLKKVEKPDAFFDLQNLNILTYERGKNDVSAKFYTPTNRSCTIAIIVITTSPCNKMEISDISGYSLSEEIFTGRPQNIPEFSDSAFLKKFNDLGLYVYSYEITHTAVEGRSKRYYINMIGNSTTRNKANGASSILVVYK
ncbi:MAG: hypothetical protein IT220_01340 [Flavobacteriaceae bacterium]|nr:hypothetical protein [Flavobacteriaceae bacterium]